MLGSVHPISSAPHERRSLPAAPGSLVCAVSGWAGAGATRVTPIRGVNQRIGRVAPKASTWLGQASTGSAASPTIVSRWLDPTPALGRSGVLTGAAAACRRQSSGGQRWLRGEVCVRAQASAAAACPGELRAGSAATENGDRKQVPCMQSPMRLKHSSIPADASRLQHQVSERERSEASAQADLSNCQSQRTASLPPAQSGWGAQPPAAGSVAAAAICSTRCRAYARLRTSWRR